MHIKKKAHSINKFLETFGFAEQ